MIEEIRCVVQRHDVCQEFLMGTLLTHSTIVRYIIASVRTAVRKRQQLFSIDAEWKACECLDQTIG
jgi:hypothetical protein